MAQVQTQICRVDSVRGADGVMMLPVSGAGANIPLGTILMPGVTGGTNIGVAIPITASSNADAIGCIAEKHVFSGSGSSGDATTATLVNWYSPFTQYPPSRPVNLLNTCALVRVDYSLVSTLAVASATSTVLTITSLAGSADSSFFYVNAGTGIGELNWAKTTASGSATLTSASNTTLDNTSKLTQILPLFYSSITWLINTASVATLIDSAAAAGSGGASILQNMIGINGSEFYLDPKAFHKKTGLQNVANLSMYSKVALVDTIFNPGS